MQEKQKENTAIIILAAGRSNRLGSPKQLLNYQGKSLLQHTIDSALESRVKLVIIVLGYDAEEIENQIREQSALILKNPDWATGMASSIRLGINFLKKQEPMVDNALIMVCDQPHVSKELIKLMIQKRQEKNTSIIACSYSNTIGTPVLFHNQHFEDLTQLMGDQGAKSILMKYPESIEIIQFEQGRIDIDTPENYKNLIE